VKVIGITEEGWNKKYICTVEHTELEKFLGLYYDKLKKLKPGDEVDLGKGYDHADEIKDAMTKTRDFVQANQKVITAILNGLSIESLLRQAEGSPPSESDG
jgi:hypothetical protein